MKKIILVLLALILAACSQETKSEYDLHLEKRDSARIDHYRYSLHYICFCPNADKIPLQIEVQNGEVVSMTYVDGTPVPEDDPMLEFYSEYSTIDRVFSSLKAELEGEADEVTVTYNSSLGYPEQINIDRVKETVDDELMVQVTNFEVLE